jgi:hypothetical protein
LFPNPAHQAVQISIQNSPETIENIIIHDLLGKKVIAIDNIASSQTSIDVSTLAKGVYLVEITTENHFKQIKKLVIK